MKQRSQRGGGSSQERSRLAGKGSDPLLIESASGVPGPYRATTMLVHFRETPYGPPGKRQGPPRASRELRLDRDAVIGCRPH
jgi:hypothetical protein